MPPARRIRNPVTMDDPARRHQQIQAELARIGITLPGSLTSRTTRCQRPGCHCHASPPILHGPHPTWTRKAWHPLHHQDPHPRRSRTAPPLLHRPPPPAPAHHRTRSHLHRTRRTAPSTRNAARPARRSRDQPLTGEPDRNRQHREISPRNAGTAPRKPHVTPSQRVLSSAHPNRGNFPHNRHRLNTRPGHLLAAGLPRLLPAGRRP